VVDILYIDGSPVLHIVDEATSFQAAKWLKDISAGHTWNVLRQIWIDTYLGPPDVIKADAGRNFTSKEFKQHATSMQVTIDIVPVEAHWSIGLVERYHQPLRRAYEIIKSEAPDTTKDMALQMAVKAVNDTAGPNGLVPTLLVFGAYPKMTDSDASATTVNQRAKAIQLAMKEVNRLHATQQVQKALATRNGPDTSTVLDAPINSKLWVWREAQPNNRAGWKGPYPLLSCDGERCTLQLPNGPTNFRTTQLKRYYEEETPSSDEEDEPLSPSLPDMENSTEPPKRRRSTRTRRPTLKLQDTPNANITINLTDIFTAKDDLYEASRQKEIDGLLQKGVFDIINHDSVPPGIRIFGSRFVDEIKQANTPQAFAKSRLVVQAYRDEGKQQVLTQSPTIQRVSQRLMLCLSVSLPDHQLHLRDITQAYVQSETNLIREFYIEPPVEMGLSKDVILKVVKPLYGIPEAGNHWFSTYHKLHTDILNMKTSTYDPCLLYRRGKDGTIDGITGMQTDDTLMTCNKTFAMDEESTINNAQIMSKARQTLTTEMPLMFNGAVVKRELDGSITVTQPRQCQNLSLIDTKNPVSTTSARGKTRDSLSTKDQYVAQRARGAYIASVCQPEAAYDLSTAAQVSMEPTDD
jgi:Reverse transcriptase (RNA-dependent DNA polymerase)